MTRHIKRGGRVWIRIFPDKPISKKPAEVRMGNGKGNVEYYVAEIQPGKVLYEMDGVNEDAGPRGVRARGRQAADLDRLRLPHGRRLSATGDDKGTDMKAKELRAKDPAALKKELDRAAEGAFLAAHADRDAAVEQHQPAGQDPARHRAGSHRDEREGDGQMTTTQATRLPPRPVPGAKRTLVGRVVSNKMQQDGHGAGRAPRQASGLRQVHRAERPSTTRMPRRPTTRATWSRSRRAARFRGPRSGRS